MPNSFIDPCCVPDVFACELTLVEDLGGVFRFTFSSKVQGEKIAVARVVLLAEAVQAARTKTAAAVVNTVGERALCVCPRSRAH